MGVDYYVSQNGLEVKDMLQDDHTRFTEREAFYFGNILKYIARAGRKEDDVNISLDKAKDYYNTLVFLDHYSKTADNLIEFRIYVKERLRKSCLALGCADNWKKFVDAIS